MEFLPNIQKCLHRADLIVRKQSHVVWRIIILQMKHLQYAWKMLNGQQVTARLVQEVRLTFVKTTTRSINKVYLIYVTTKVHRCKTCLRKFFCFTELTHYIWIFTLVLLVNKKTCYIQCYVILVSRDVRKL